MLLLKIHWSSNVVSARGALMNVNFFSPKLVYQFSSAVSKKRELSSDYTVLIARALMDVLFFIPD